MNNIHFEVNYGEILGIAGIAGNGQIELMETLTGEKKCQYDKEILFDNKPIGFKGVQERRDLGIETIPEERNFHASVPDLRLHENTFLTCHQKYFATKNFFSSLFINPQYSLDESIRIIEDNDVRCPEKNPFASQLSGGNLQKFILGRSLASNPKVAIFSQPTWGVDIGAATLIRQKLLNIANDGKAVILISQDLEEIFQLSDKISVISNGYLSDIKSIKDISAIDVGLLMGSNLNNSNENKII